MMSQRGYTLIEVLVASAIFVGVMVIGVSSFSSINRVSEQIQVTRTLSQTGNFVMETLSRDIRSATGEKNPLGGGFGVDYPFDFVVDSADESALSGAGLITAHKIRTRRQGTNSCNPTSPIVKTYRLVSIPGTANSDLTLQDGNGVCLQSSSLLPANVQISNLTFVGLSHQSSSTVQPFVTIKFTLVDTSPGSQGSQQTFQTTVTSLVYAGQ
jgi:prepilin-type N-terminal cleavage/methylation domain-containing protein